MSPAEAEFHEKETDVSRASGRRAPADVAPHQVERSLKQGAYWAFGAMVASQVIRLLSVVVLARLLTPSDYGAAALALTIASYSLILGDLGYGTALVQASTASQRWPSTAWFCALAAGTIGFGIVALAAYPAARIVGDPEVAGLMIAGGSTLFLVATGSTSNALLTRAMDFRTVQGASALAWLPASAAAIVAAAAGAGAPALIVQQVVLAAMTSGMLIVVARWRPSLEFSRTAFWFMTKFALPVTGGAVFFVLQGFITAILIGHLLGVEDLGIWSLSMAMVILPLSLLAGPIIRVVYAAFARMRDRPERVAELWLNGTALLAAAILPAVFGLIAIAPDLIPFVFGPRWDEAIPVVQILSLFVMIRSLQTWNISVMDSVGKPHVSMAINAVAIIILPPFIWAGSAYGLEGVAAFYVAAVLLGGEFPSFVVTTRQLAVSAGDVLVRIRGVAISALLMCGVVVLGRRLLTDAQIPAGERILVEIAVGAIVYFALLTLLARDVAGQLFRLLAGMRGTPGKGDSLGHP